MEESSVRFAIDCDDAAVDFKNVIYKHLKDKGIDITDLEYAKDNNVAYPDIGYNLAKKIKSGEYDRGLLICGTGLGMAIIANKVEGIYAGVCHDVYSAQRLSKSNNAQIITMGARVIGLESAKVVVDAWLDSEFEATRSKSKVDRIQVLEQQSFHDDSD